MLADGLTLDEAELVLSEAFNDSTGWARARAEATTTASAQATSDPANTEDADHIEMVESSESLSLNTIIDGRQDDSAGAGSSSAYGLQDDEYRRIDADPEPVTENQAPATFPMAAEDYYQQDLNAGRVAPLADLSHNASPVFDFEAPNSLSAPPGAEVTCEGCGCPLEIGAAYCGGCGNLYTVSYWRVNYGWEPVADTAMEGFS